MEGVLYCKPHFEQLFKESGNLTKNFQASVAKSAEKLTPELTRSPSKAAGMFSGTQEKCATCGKTAYPLEKGLGHVVQNSTQYPLVVSTWPFIEAVQAAWKAAENGFSAVDLVVEGCSACEELRCDGTDWSIVW